MVTIAYKLCVNVQWLIRVDVWQRPHYCKAIILQLKKWLGTSLVVQWLRFHASTVGSIDSIPGWRTKIPDTTWHGQKFLIEKELI